MMRRYRLWRPDDASTLAEWVDNELASGAFDEAIRENIENNPRDFETVIMKLIAKGEFDEAVIQRAEALGYVEVKG